MFKWYTISMNRLTIAVIITVCIFLLGWILGSYGPDLMSSAVCYTLLGCNAGFFGYDAVLHFVSGIMDVLLILWVTRQFPQVNLFHDRYWKNALIILALVAFIAVTWETIELAHDQFLMKVFHENLRVPNHLTQPSNDDTMGDMIFSLVGAACTIRLLRPFIIKMKRE